jgi:hypothetical protein
MPNREDNFLAFYLDSGEPIQFMIGPMLREEVLAKDNDTKS